MNNEELKELKRHHQLVQSGIDEIIRYQYDKKLMKIELQSVIDGYADYLKRNGFGGIEITLILNLLEFNKFYIN